MLPYWLVGLVIAVTLSTIGIAAQQAAPDGQANHGFEGPAGAAGAPRQGRPAPPAADPEAITRGTTLYKTNCAFCHGSDARGGLAPDLASSAFVIGDEGTGKSIGAFIKTGRPDKGMPAFATFTDAQNKDLGAYLLTVIADARRRIPMDVNAIVVGDAKAGEAYFNGAGKCSSCHSPTGDLKGIGSKYDPAMLQDHMINPRAARGGTHPPPATVTVTPKNGPVVSGSLVSINDFFVTLIDGNGVRRTFSIDPNEDEPKVAVHDPAQAHLDMLLHFKDSDMHNLTAYLVTLK